MEFTAIVLLEDGRSCSHGFLQTVSIRTTGESIQAGGHSALFGDRERFGAALHDLCMEALCVMLVTV
jgi:hypothetical protein